VVRFRVLISGRVQGVFFRDTCRRLAEQRGVAGWVRNLPDGGRTGSTTAGIFFRPPQPQRTPRDSSADRFACTDATARNASRR